MSKSIKLSPLSGRILYVLEEAGEESVATIANYMEVEDYWNSDLLIEDLSKSLNQLVYFNAIELDEELIKGGKLDVSIKKFILFDPATRSWRRRLEGSSPSIRITDTGKLLLIS